MFVIARPAFSNREKNPYNSLLYEALKEQGVQASDAIGLKSLWRSRVLHFHWPEIFLNHSLLHKFFGHLFVLSVCIIAAKIFRLRVVWTVHNLKPHESKWPIFERLFYATFPKFCSGLIFLSEYTRRVAFEKYPSMRGLHSAVIPIGDYSPIIFSRARESINEIDSSTCARVSYFGVIRRYKNVPGLVREFKKLPRDMADLYIAGKVVNDGELEAEIVAEIGGSKNIKATFEFLDEADLLRYIAASNLIVLPYSDIANSGSVLLALAMGKRILAPSLGSLPEVQRSVGSHWLRLYQGTLRSEDIRSALIGIEELEGKKPDLQDFSWDSIAEKTAKFYSSL